MTVRYEVVEASSAAALDFDPAEGSKRGQATCRVCGATVTYDYVRAEGQAGRLMVTPLCAVILKARGRGREYVPVGYYELPDDGDCLKRIEGLPVSPPEELQPFGDTRWFSTPPFGLTRFRDLFTPRQLLTLCTLAAGVRDVYEEMRASGTPDDRAAAVATCLALALDRAADYMTVLCQWHTPIEKTNHTFARQAIPMVWDFSEVNPFFGASGDIRGYIRNTADIIDQLNVSGTVVATRASATGLPC